ncbi:hypothetical protein MNBD_GAMMA21-2610 [hydrothermal vent metagenome]|uniref:Uncharacterized protein n=1 Tax=hydrothermal vent metagenome TaxID=652676 RepID=A0A3B1B506_9ZZZZ
MTKGIIKVGLFVGALLGMNAVIAEPIKYADESAKYLKYAMELDKGCKWIAKVKEWDNPEKIKHGYPFKLHVGPYLVSVPDGIKDIILMSHNVLAISYNDKSVIYLSAHVIPESYGLVKISDTRTNKISPAEVVDVIFMKTHCDKNDVPEYDYDKFIWHLALFQKSLHFRDEGNEVFKTRSGKLTYYVSEGGKNSPNSGNAYVTNIEQKNDVLVIDASHMSFDKFKQIVFSVREYSHPKED